MDNSNDMEFVFWLDFWRKNSALWPKPGHFKCVITGEKIRVIPTENATHEELSIDIPLIQKCGLGYTGNRNHHVVLFLSGERFLLGPVHPLDPNGIQNFNHKETSAFIKVIEAFQANTNPKIETNPYLRQLAEKNNLKGFNIPDIKWDKHTSPWAYDELSGHKFLRLKIFVRNITQVIAIAIVVTAVILGVVYVLAKLNVICWILLQPLHLLKFDVTGVTVINANCESGWCCEK
jgi:hypothetical protein